jgi:probable HAF family extracellular repeat protein
MNNILRSLAAMLALTVSVGSQTLPTQQLPASAQTKPRAYQFRSVDYPGAYLSSVNGFNGKIALGVSDFTSFYFDGTTYKILTIPGCLVNQLSGINSLGVMVGACYPGGGYEVGFTFDGKTAVTFGVPGQSVWPSAINNAGQIVGYYDSANSQTAFLYENGNFTTLAYPGALATQPTGINSLGDVVGTFVDSSKISRAFLLKNGVYARFNYPFAAQTFLFSINDSDDMVGWAFNVAGQSFDFIYIDGIFYQVEITDGTVSLQGITNNGDVYGTIYDSLGNAHGMIGQ